MIKQHADSQYCQPVTTALNPIQGLLCNSFLGLFCLFGETLEYTTQNGTTQEVLGKSSTRMRGLLARSGCVHENTHTIATVDATVSW